MPGSGSGPGTRPVKGVIKNELDRRTIRRVHPRQQVRRRSLIGTEHAPLVAWCAERNARLCQLMHVESMGVGVELDGADGVADEAMFAGAVELGGEAEEDPAGAGLMSLAT